MILLDAAATTPVRREVLEAMTPHLTYAFGNPSSRHEPGLAAREALDDARRRAARALGRRPREIVFTSGGTESNNLAIKGVAMAATGTGARRVVTTPIEHSSVTESCEFLARVLGFAVDVVPVSPTGRVDPDDVARALRDDTAIVAIGAANNEIGTTQPMREIAAECRAFGVPLHVDGVQAAGWLPLDEIAGDTLAVSGHKIGAPKGAGVLAVRRGVPIEPLLHGGGQEHGLRAGTEPVALAVGVATALEIAATERAAAVERATAVRDDFIARVLSHVPGARLTGDATARLPGIASFVFPGTSGERILIELERRGVLASSGSACRAHDDAPSPVLTALGIGEDDALSAVRFSLPHGHASDLGPVAEALAEIVASGARR